MTNEQRFSAEITRDWSRIPDCFFPSKRTGRNEDGIRILFRTDQKEWLAHFDFGLNEGLTDIFAIAEDLRLVVSKGAGYWVRSSSACAAEEVEVFPIVSVILRPELSALMVADFTTITAFVNGKLLWRSKRLCDDSLRLDGVQDDSIFFSGYSGQRGLLTGGVINVKTGNLVKAL